MINYVCTIICKHEQVAHMMGYEQVAHMMGHEQIAHTMGHEQVAHMMGHEQHMIDSLDLRPFIAW